MIANRQEIAKYGSRMFVLHHLGHSGGAVNQFLNYDSREIHPIWRGGGPNENIIRALKLGYVIVKYEPELHDGGEHKVVYKDDFGRTIDKSVKIPLSIKGCEIAVVQPDFPLDAGSAVWWSGYIPGYAAINNQLQKALPRSLAFRRTLAEEILGVHTTLQPHVTNLLLTQEMRYLSLIHI